MHTKNYLKLAIFFLPIFVTLIYCNRNRPKAKLESQKNATSAMTSDTITDYVRQINCQIRLKHNIINVPKGDFPHNSKGNAIINVVINKEGKIATCDLLYLTIKKDNKEVYSFDTNSQIKSGYLEKIKVIKERIVEEFNKATITCDSFVNETRLRIRVLVELK